MESSYKAWIGSPVVLKVVSDDLHIPLRGRLLSETDRSVRVRVGDCWDIDIFKSMIQGISHDNAVFLVH